MFAKPLKTCSVVLLLIYGMYALSPNYATLPGSAAGKGLAGASLDGVNVRILWVGVLLESLVEDVQGASAGAEQVAAAPQDEDLLLIRKKRAVNSRPFTLPPPRPLIAIISFDHEQPSPVQVSYDVPRDLLHCRADGCFSLKAGLSPPSVNS